MAILNHIIDSGWLIRGSIVLANLWLVGTLREAYNSSGNLSAMANLAAFGVFGFVMVIGSALVIQKLCERRAPATSGRR